MRKIFHALRQDLWSPYTAGALLGIVAVLSMWVAGHTIGASGAFESIAAYVGVELTSTESMPQTAQPVEVAPSSEEAQADEAFWGGEESSTGEANADEDVWGAEAAQSTDESTGDEAVWGTEADTGAAPVAESAPQEAPQPVTVAKEGLEKQFTFFAYISPKGISWMVWMLLGVFFGSMASSMLSGGFKISLMPHSPQWVEAFGPQVWKRWVIVFFGGIVIIVAAGISGGCTSGLAIAKGVQLHPAAFLFIIGMFITGPIVAAVVYRRRF